MQPPNERPQAIALAGPTAAGKSGAALALAREFDAEIVSVDSALVYRGMDIGTAKPTREEQAAVPHHLIDIRNPAQPYSAAEFAADAGRLIDEINARGRMALLVGGTMLYFKALFEGLAPMPAADARLRAELEGRAQALGWPVLHAELARVDPATAGRLAPNDAQRIQRALEVFHASGTPLSAWHAAGRGERPLSALAATPLFSLEPQDRRWLHVRIAQRFDTMLALGFLDEVRALRARRDLHPDLPSMRCVGYRQAWALLQAAEQRGEESAGTRGEATLRERLREPGIFATRQLAKRQLTWLRGVPRRTVIACDAADALPRLLRAVGEALA